MYYDTFNVSYASLIVLHLLLIILLQIGDVFSVFYEYLPYGGKLLL